MRKEIVRLNERFWRECVDIAQRRPSTNSAREHSELQIIVLWKISTSTIEGHGLRIGAIHLRKFCENDNFSVAFTRCNNDYYKFEFKQLGKQL